jgi:hypothetical protein
MRSLQLAKQFASLAKTAQTVAYPFDPEQDFLGLRAAAVVNKVKQIVADALPDSASGMFEVFITVGLDKSFKILVPKAPAAVQMLVSQFGEQIKGILAETQPPKKPVKWLWVKFEVS